MNKNGIGLFFVSVVWNSFSIGLITMYSGGRFGPTPLYLPIFFAAISFVGIVVSIWAEKIKEVDMSLKIISALMYLMSIMFQLNAFTEILYV